jgi:hypothetical protein
VDNAGIEAITGVAGPLTKLQLVEAIVAPPLPVAVPVSVAILTGSVMEGPVPALTLGGCSASTVMVTVDVDVCPVSSVTVKVNT